MQTTIPFFPWLLLIFVLLILVVSIFLAKPLLRYLIARITNDAMTKLLTDDYDQNLAELLPSLTRFSVLNLLELSLRAENGTILTRPLGSPKHFIGYDNLMFSPRQMTKLSLPESAQIDMEVTLGGECGKTANHKDSSDDRGYGLRFGLE